MIEIFTIIEKSFKQNELLNIIDKNTDLVNLKIFLEKVKYLKNLESGNQHE
jgi:hypothetical protein